MIALRDRLAQRGVAGELVRRIGQHQGLLAAVDHRAEIAQWVVLRLQRQRAAEFSKRLAAAMTAQGYEPRPGVLSTQFNVRFQGASVAFQTASRWLNGKTIPEYEKLVALADWLKADPCFLLFGDRVAHGKRDHRQVKEYAPAYDGQKVFDIYRTLPATQQKAVCEVIMAFAAASSRRSSPTKPKVGAKVQRHRS